MEAKHISYRRYCWVRRILRIAAITYFTASAGGSSLPVVFLGASLIAYFNMAAVPDSTSRLVGAVAVGLVTTVASGVGAVGGAVCGLVGGALMGGACGSKDAAKGLAVLFGIVGGIAGYFGGMIEGYGHAKDFAVEKLRQPAAVVQPALTQ